MSILCRNIIILTTFEEISYSVIADIFLFFWSHLVKFSAHCSRSMYAPKEIARCVLKLAIIKKSSGFLVCDACSSSNWLMSASFSRTIKLFSCLISHVKKDLFKLSFLKKTYINLSNNEQRFFSDGIEQGDRRKKLWRKYRHGSSWKSYHSI